MTNTELNSHQKAILTAINSHNLWGVYVAFSISFTACAMTGYLLNFLFSSLQLVSAGLILILSIVFTVILVTSARRARDNGQL